MSTNHEIRKEARRVLEGNWGTAVLITILYYAITSVLGVSTSFPFANNVYLSNGGSVLLTILCLPLAWGFTTYFLYVVREQEVGINNLFSGYSGKRFGKILFTLLLKYIYLVLWTLLLVIPGIIKALSYSMTEFILLDNPELDGTDAIHRSRVMMDGHKMKLFLMILSFTGWFFLACLTLGLGFFLLVPYIHTSLAAFYKDLKKEENERIRAAYQAEMADAPEA